MTKRRRRRVAAKAGHAQYLAMLGRRHLGIGTREQVLALIHALAEAGRSVAKVRVYSMRSVSVRTSVVLDGA